MEVEEGRDPTNASSDDDVLFVEPLIKKDGGPSKRKAAFGIYNLPEKMMRKQVIGPDFGSSLKNLEAERKDSSNEGESPPPGSNGLSVEFPCPVCKKIFRKKGHLTGHLLTHEPEKPYGCELCSKRYSDKRNLRSHLTTRHKTDAKPFECKICGKHFTLRKELDKHVLSHKYKKKHYPCHLCELEFMTKWSLDSHLETHPEANIYHCSRCEKSFPSKYSLTLHERTHGNVEPYHCNVCKLGFGTKIGLHKHLLSHESDENKPLSCHICEKQFSFQQMLNFHVETHASIKKAIKIKGRVYPCQYCEETFPKKSILVRHEFSHTHGRRKLKNVLPISRTHKNKTVVGISGVANNKQDNKKPFACDFCSKRYADNRNLQNHLSTQHNAVAKPFQCNICDKSFNLKKELDQHMISHKESNKPMNDLYYLCHLCELKFITKEELSSHLEIHPEARIYHCRRCNKSFRSKHNLMGHEMSHRTGKPYYHCDFCNIRMATKNSLHVHLQAHESEANQPLSCHLCSRRFTVEQNLEIHIISDHNQSSEKPFACDLIETHGSIDSLVYACQYCEQTFVRKHNLARHEVSHTRGKWNPKYILPKRIANENNEAIIIITNVANDNENDGSATVPAEDYSMKPFNSTNSGPDQNYISVSCEYSAKFESEDLSCTTCNTNFETEHALNEHIQTHESESGKDVQNHINQQEQDLNEHIESHEMEADIHVQKHINQQEESIETNDKSDKNDRNINLNRDSMDSTADDDILFANVGSNFKKNKMEAERQDTSDEGNSPSVGSNRYLIILNKFPCPICKKKFRKKEYIKRHLLLMHNAENKPFACDFCSKRYADKWNLQAHLSTQHNPDPKPKPFECDMCDKRYALKKKLDQHMLSHKNSKKPINDLNYPCNLCELNFTTKEDFSSHLEMHPIYHCHRCNKSFKRKYYLTQHKRTHNTDSAESESDPERDESNDVQKHINLRVESSETDNKCGENNRNINLNLTNYVGNLVLPSNSGPYAVAPAPSTSISNNIHPDNWNLYLVIPAPSFTTTSLPVVAGTSHNLIPTMSSNEEIERTDSGYIIGL